MPALELNFFLYRATFILVKKVSTGQKKLISDFLANIGVAWFAAGVIGVFISGTKNFLEIMASVSWGLLFSLIFVSSGFYFLKGVKS